MISYLELIGTIVGLLYLWLEYRASIYLWIASIVMPAIYVVVYYQAGLYADFGINIYFLLASLYGLFFWLYKGRSSAEGKELPVTRMPYRYYVMATVIFASLFAVIAYILVRYTDSSVPYIDSFTTALSVVAMWMLARKYVEQWLVWIVVDVASAGLYVYKELYFTAMLYALYSIIAYFGYRKWKTLLRLPL